MAKKHATTPHNSFQTRKLTPAQSKAIQPYEAIATHFATLRNDLAELAPPDILAGLLHCQKKFIGLLIDEAVRQGIVNRSGNVISLPKATPSGRSVPRRQLIKLAAREKKA